MNFIFITPNEFKGSSHSFDDLSGFRMIPNNHIFRNWIDVIPEKYIDIMPKVCYYGDYINRVIIYLLENINPIHQSEMRSMVQNEYD